MLYIRIALSHLKYFGLILEQTPENYKNHESIISTTRYYAITECSETFGPSFCIQVFGLYFPLDAEKNFLRFQKGYFLHRCLIKSNNATILEHAVCMYMYYLVYTLTFCFISRLLC